MCKTLRETPQVGDIIVHCGHDNVQQHFWKPDTGFIQFHRPGGTWDLARWVTCCDECHQKCGGDVKKVEIKGDGVWQ